MSSVRTTETLNGGFRVYNIGKKGPVVQLTPTPNGKWMHVYEVPGTTLYESLLEALHEAQQMTEDEDLAEVDELDLSTGFTFGTDFGFDVDLDLQAHTDDDTGIEEAIETLRSSLDAGDVDGTCTLIEMLYDWLQGYAQQHYDCNDMGTSLQLFQAATLLSLSRLTLLHALVRREDQQHAEDRLMMLAALSDIPDTPQQIIAVE